jgi:TolB-like protein
MKSVTHLAEFAGLESHQPHERHAVQRAAHRAICAKSGQQLGVAHVVEGSVQRAANKIRGKCAVDRRAGDAHLGAQT